MHASVLNDLSLSAGVVAELADKPPNASELASGIHYISTSVALTAPRAPGSNPGRHEVELPSPRTGGGPHPPPPPPAPVPLLPLLVNETELSLRAFTDGPGKSIEVYYMGGRTVHTAMFNTHDGHAVETPAGMWRGGMALWNSPSSTASVEAISAKVWTMGSVWATEAEVLATPRRDGK